MDYTEEIDDDRKIIFVRVLGDLAPKETASMGTQMRQKAKELDYRIIFDFRSTKNYISIIQAYNWFIEYYDKIDIDLSHIPVAHLTDEDDEDFFSFVETTFAQKGVTVKVFKEEGPAIEWLQSL